MRRNDSSRHCCSRFGTRNFNEMPTKLLRRRRPWRSPYLKANCHSERRMPATFPLPERCNPLSLPKLHRNPTADVPRRLNYGLVCCFSKFANGKVKDFFWRLVHCNVRFGSKADTPQMSALGGKRTIPGHNATRLRCSSRQVFQSGIKSVLLEGEVPMSDGLRFVQGRGQAARKLLVEALQADRFSVWWDEQISGGSSLGDMRSRLSSMPPNV